MFKANIHDRNSTLDVSKTISHDKMLHYRFLIDITVSSYFSSLKSQTHQQGRIQGHLKGAPNAH